MTVRTAPTTLDPAPDRRLEAPLRRTLAIARPAAGRLTLATLFGAASIGTGVALLATSGWLIARASQHPSVVVLGLAIVGVRFFAISRGIFRYAERLVGHDAAFRVLADLRGRVYERLEVLAPSGLPVSATCSPVSCETWTPSRTSCCE